jgi:deoxyribodipyrimidine photo-lyase
MPFPTNYSEIIERINHIDPVAYGKTRNYIDGAVTRLSPYISRGVISLPIIKDEILKRYNRYQSEKILQELAWREYWQSVWEAKGNSIFTDLKHIQTDVQSHQIPSAILNVSTGIIAIDQCIQELYNTGYMHNHCRMYIASIICNIAKSHWHYPAQWMYYHLLDGDLASNSLSWQWVAGTFSSKKYYCNQENINKYCHTQQSETFLDHSYEALPSIEIPDSLKSTISLSLETKLPQSSIPIINTKVPTLIYNAYNLDPLWYEGQNVNRVLLLEPSHYTRYPVSEKVLAFIIALGRNIPDLQIFTGNFEALQQHTGSSTIIFKQHPGYRHYQGKMETYDRLFPQINGYFPSFFSYWNQCKKYI